MKFKLLEISVQINTCIMNLSPKLNSFHVLVLNTLFGRFFGLCYPKELIEPIIMASYEPIQVSAGWGHNILVNDKTTYVWGFNQWSQLGLADNIHRNVPQELPKFSRTSSTETNRSQNIISIELIKCNTNHTIVLTKSNQIYVWGLNDEVS